MADAAVATSQPGFCARGPFPPLRLGLDRLEGLAWGRDGEGRRFLNVLLQRAAGFPSVPLACAADPLASSAVAEIARQLNHLGVHAFVARSGPVPLAALSATVVERRFPLGLYVNIECRCDKSLEAASASGIELLLIGGDGGCLERLDTLAAVAGTVLEPLERDGLCGELDMLTPYVRQLTALLDPDPEGGGGPLAALVCPFPGLLEALAAQSLRGRRLADPHDERGWRAVLSPDGQRLAVTGLAGRPLAGATLATALAAYLVGERRAGGRVMGPASLPLAGGVEQEVLPGVDWLQLAYRAGRVDLLLAWLDDGWLVHQGQGPFGDGLLTLAYLLESGFKA